MCEGVEGAIVRQERGLLCWGNDVRREEKSNQGTAWMTVDGR